MPPNALATPEADEVAPARGRRYCEKLVVGVLYDLADPCYPTPQRLEPHLAGVAFGRADKPRSVAPEPPEVVICPLKALLDHVG